jgi:hypothetical protein
VTDSEEIGIVDEAEDALDGVDAIYMAKLRVYAGAAKILIQRIADGKPFGKKMARRFLERKVP